MQKKKTNSSIVLIEKMYTTNIVLESIKKKFTVVTCMIISIFFYPSLKYVYVYVPSSS